MYAIRSYYEHADNENMPGFIRESDREEQESDKNTRPEEPHIGIWTKKEVQQKRDAEKSDSLEDSIIYWQQSDRISRSLATTVITSYSIHYTKLYEVLSGSDSEA